MRRSSYCIECFAIAVAALSHVGVALADETVRIFQRTLATSIEEPVSLSVAVSRGDVSIGYSRDDQVVLYASGKDAAGKSLPEEYFTSNLVIDQKDNRVQIRDTSSTGLMLAGLYSITYRIDVPYRTEVDSVISGAGNQRLTGVYGPAKLETQFGDIDATFVRFAPVQARTQKGNISCIRAFGVDAETGAGNISLQETGNSKIAVKSGRGKIEITGARGTVDGSTDAGSLHIRAVLRDDWRLNSRSGSIRIELPKESKFEIDANSDSGEIDVERDDMERPESEIQHLHQQVNGGGKHIVAHSVKGSISVE